MQTEMAGWQGVPLYLWYLGEMGEMGQRWIVKRNQKNLWGFNSIGGVVLCAPYRKKYSKREDAKLSLTRGGIDGCTYVLYCCT